MSREEAFAPWKSVAGPWSRWIKVSLFAQAPARVEPVVPPLPDVGWAPAAGSTALILDLPGVESVATACALASRGYCPVALFNTSCGPSEVVRTSDLIAALLGAGSLLAARSMGPPVFLLDSDRAGRNRAIGPGDFDNRWFVFAGDFPSAKMFRELGIDRILVAGERGLVAEDLRDALSEQADMPLSTIEPREGVQRAFPGPPWKILKFFRVLWRGLKRNADDTFGHVVEQPSSHTHG